MVTKRVLQGVVGDRHGDAGKQHPDQSGQQAQCATEGRVGMDVSVADGERGDEGKVDSFASSQAFQVRDHDAKHHNQKQESQQHLPDPNTEQ